MTDIEATSYFLSFDGFSIEIRVDEKSSVNFSRQFSHHDPDFVFAVAEIWLHQKGSKHIIVPATHPGNFLEDLRDLGTRILNPPSVLGIEDFIPCGGWCSWMARYWGRVDNESDTADDEKLYELLIPLSFVESRIGHIAVYMYGGRKIFEVAVRPGEGRGMVGAWSQFSSDTLGNEVSYLEKVIVANIRSAANGSGSN